MNDPPSQGAEYFPALSTRNSEACQPFLDGHDLRGLEVTVDDSSVVGGGESSAQSETDPQDAHPVEWLRDFVELSAFDKFIGDVGLSFDFANPVHRDDVGMLEPGNRLGFPTQAIAGMRVRKAGRDELDRNQSIQGGVARQLYHRHAAGPKRTKQLEAIESHPRFGAPCLRAVHQNYSVTAAVRSISLVREYRSHRRAASLLLLDGLLKRGNPRLSIAKTTQLPEREAEKQDGFLGILHLRVSLSQLIK